MIYKIKDSTRKSMLEAYDKENCFKLIILCCIIIIFAHNIMYR